MSTATESDPADSLNRMVAAEMRAWLGRRKLSQTELASAVGQNVMWVRRRLAGDQALTLVDLEVMARGLLIDPIDLFPTAELPIVRPTRRAPVDPDRPTRALDRRGVATRAHLPRSERGSTVTRLVRRKPGR